MTAEFKHKLILYITIAVLLAVVFVQRGCTRKGLEVVKVKIPEKTGTIQKHTAIIDHTTKKDTVRFAGKDIYTENPVNKQMAEGLIKALKDKDSLRIVNLYLNAIQEREQTRVFSNKDLSVDVWVKTRGEILDMKVDWKIKEQEIKVQIPVKTTVLALYAGTGLETTTRLDKLVPKISLGVQNKKGDILTVSYGITDQSVGVGYVMRIFNIKR